MRPLETLNALHKGRGAAEIATAVWAERSRGQAVMPLARSKKPSRHRASAAAQSIATLRLARVLMNGTAFGW
jgi:hypothetical protein